MCRQNLRIQSYIQDDDLTTTLTQPPIETMTPPNTSSLQPQTSLAYVGAFDS